MGKGSMFRDKADNKKDRIQYTSYQSNTFILQNLFYNTKPEKRICSNYCYDNTYRKQLPKERISHIIIIQNVYIWSNAPKSTSSNCCEA